MADSKRERSAIGNGYGSECHLLRYLGRHRSLLDERVGQAIGGEVLGWLDFHFGPKGTWPDGEREGLDFLDEPTIQEAWGRFWPQTGSAQNWDAVGRVRVEGEDGWLLVEAKGNAEELRSSCKAKESGGRPQIEAALGSVKGALGVAEERDWLKGYYQACNRIAVLHFLLELDVPARLLFLYFTGDRTPKRTCPRSEVEWSKALGAQVEHIGLPDDHALKGRIHSLFLPVDG